MLLCIVLKQDNSHPIGIFDSGIGGLTVANAIAKRLPNESFIYFGDTAHLPYGDKSAEAIKHYSKKIASFLQSQQCKMVVIACNTASAVGYKTLLSQFEDKELLINVIDPVVEHVRDRVGKGKVGIIGTKRTVSTRSYSKKIKSLAPHLQTTELATPLLAPMIEEGYFNNNISQTIINDYLSKKPLANIDALILACTHYPLIQGQVEKYYKQEKRNIPIVDSANVVAQKVEQVLKQKSMLYIGKDKPAYRFYVSDYTTSFENTAKIFFHEKIRLEYYPMWQ